MSDFQPKIALIVGAGASKNHGLPLASEFTRFLLRRDRLKEAGPSVLQQRHLIDFVEEIFTPYDSKNPDEWPSLEDVFTNIDLAANSVTISDRGRRASCALFVGRSFPGQSAPYLKLQEIIRLALK